MRVVFLAIAVSAAIAIGLPSTALAQSRDCGSFRATSFTGSKAHVGVAVNTGPVGCRQARRVLRYSITHRETSVNSNLGSPKGWVCARGGPEIFPTAAGYSCEARHPRRIVTGLFL